MTNKLTLKDREFADLWRGGPDELRGNAAAIYRHMHPKCKPATAETNGPAVLRKTQVKEYLDIKSGELSKKCDVDAEYVLRQSIRYLEIAIGDRPAPEKFNHAGVKAALELIGRHTQVQAFKDTIEHKHTHRLEQALARKSKEVEKAALERNLVLVE